METPLKDSSTREGRTLLPWHKPEVKRLSVSLDTSAGGGTNIDFSEIDPGTNTEPSDARLKQDVRGIEGALDSVLALEGVNFSYDVSKHPHLGLTGGPRIGFIAQDIEKIYPEVVTTREDGFKMVNYAQLVPVLVEAIKEQQKTVAALEEKVLMLERELRVKAKSQAD